MVSRAVTAQLICAFVFTYAKIRFSHDAAHIMVTRDAIYLAFVVFNYFFSVFARLVLFDVAMCPEEEIRCIFYDI